MTNWLNDPEVRRLIAETEASTKAALDRAASLNRYGDLLKQRAAGIVVANSAILAALQDALSALEKGERDA